MFIFADEAAYQDIISQIESNPEFSEHIIKKISDAKDVLEKMKEINIEDEVIVFLNGKGYKGDVTTVAAKIVTEFNLL